MKITKKNIYDIQIWDGNYESDLIGYSIVCWPESQYLLDHEEINEAIIVVATISKLSSSNIFLNAILPILPNPLIAILILILYSPPKLFFI